MSTDGTGDNSTDLLIVVTDSVIYFFFFSFFLMIRRPPRSTLDRSSAASDVYKRQAADAQTAYYASDRADSKGGLDLYTFTLRKDIQPTQTFWITGYVYDSITKKGLPSSVAVSYTHLRAHETVLDIVCRLLLEKKKNTNIFNITNLHSIT